MTSILLAITAINPDAVVSVIEEDYNQIIWRNGTEVISKADIVAKQAELQTAYDALKYYRDRKIAYPSIQDQMDMQYKDLLNGTTTWKDAVAKVKTDNPKE